MQLGDPSDHALDAACVGATGSLTAAAIPLRPEGRSISLKLNDSHSLLFFVLDMSITRGNCHVHN